MADNSMSAGDGRDNVPLVHRPDLFVAIVLIGISLWLFYVTSTFDEVSELFSVGLMPEVWPRLILSVIILLGLVIPFEHRLVEGGAARLDKGRNDKLPLTTYLTGALMVVIGSQMPLLGAVLTIVIICLLMPLMWGERRIGRIVLFAGGFTTTIWLLFSYALKVHFEPGLLSTFIQ
jgi:putative tricarboxylic transport membrane protein